MQGRTWHTLALVVLVGKRKGWGWVCAVGSAVVVAVKRGREFIEVKKASGKPVDG